MQHHNVRVLHAAQHLDLSQEDLEINTFLLRAGDADFLPTATGRLSSFRVAFLTTPHWPEPSAAPMVYLSISAAGCLRIALRRREPCAGTERFVWQCCQAGARVLPRARAREYRSEIWKTATSTAGIARLARRLLLVCYSAT